ncbi:hypothetical protein ACF07Y_39020 [Streptomyces sp. NPDC016566]|uniref:hypothetical protein n=1 Tax=Streptomyces sp. NPDC016566 TaxID=3364967 RepID=UPI0037013167
MPRAGQIPAFGDARASALLAKAAAAGLKPKPDVELLLVLLGLIGSRIPVSKCRRSGNSALSWFL